MWVLGLVMEIEAGASEGERGRSFVIYPSSGVNFTSTSGALTCSINSKSLTAGFDNAISMVLLFVGRLAREDGDQRPRI